MGITYITNKYGLQPFCYAKLSHLGSCTSVASSQGRIHCSSNCWAAVLGEDAMPTQLSNLASTPGMLGVGQAKTEEEHQSAWNWKIRARKHPTAIRCSILHSRPASISTKLDEKKNSAANQEEPLTLDTESKPCSIAVTLTESNLSKAPFSTPFRESWLTLATPAISPASDDKARMPPPCSAKIFSAALAAGWRRRITKIMTRRTNTRTILAHTANLQFHQCFTTWDCTWTRDTSPAFLHLLLWALLDD